MPKPISHIAFFPLFLILFPIVVFSQQITNVSFSQEGKMIKIYYDLSGTSGQTFNVSVYCSMDGGTTWGEPLKKVTGQTGTNIFPGKAKVISWDVLADKEKLTGEIMFQVRAISSSVTASASNSSSIEMVLVKGGTFTMGCTSEQTDCYSDEKPAHQVTLGDFYIGKYEVTQKQWREIMGANPSYFTNCDNCPVENVSWNDIQEFIKKLNLKTGETYRLPTEAEWEYAARGGNLSKRYKFAGSNNIDEVAWYYGNSNSKTHPVGQKKANELGLFDMSGNVWEWCSDWYGDYSSYSQNNPKGPSSGQYRSLRGGSWSSYLGGCRSSDRYRGDPDGRNVIFVGFRLSQDY